MATWKVVADRIKLFPHPNADRLMVGKVGKFQVVVGKDTGYQEGDIVVFAPERSILPEEIRDQYFNADTGISYLHGENKDRVVSIRPRGELSEGVTLPLDWVREKLCMSRWALRFHTGEDGKAVPDIPLGRDLSDVLGITKYIPPVPAGLEGKVSHMNETDFENRFHKHDVDMFRMFGDEFTPGELVDLTEKVHGSQVNIMLSPSGDITLTSKYLGAEGLLIDEDPTNDYWRALENSGLRNLLRSGQFAGDSIQVIGEMIPCHKGFNYGCKQPTIRVFRLIVDGARISLSAIFGPPHLTPYYMFAPFWVPRIAQAPFDPAVFQSYADGKEQVSGKELHIREGIVITPVLPRDNSEHHDLAVKYLNTKFKGAPTDFA